MTLAGLVWHQLSPHTDETDDGRYRVRVFHDNESAAPRYDAFACGPRFIERHLGGFESKAEAQARCAFHAFPSETAYAEQEVVR